jgi:hypothetical protein
MALLTAVITLLIYVCVFAIIIYLIVWVLGQLGIPLPAQVLKILWIIFALIVILLIARVLIGSGGLALPGISALPLSMPFG